MLPLSWDGRPSGHRHTPTTGRLGPDRQHVHLRGDHRVVAREQLRPLVEYVEVLLDHLESK
jgi:hypothetical protein